MKTVVTAYTSSPEETDETPFITASGNYAQFGVAAANFLPLGTQIRLPRLFGEQIFVVEDRLNSRYNNRVDIWLPVKNDAQNFGVKVSEIEIF
ncbi:MAG: 3D domain-containing protein [Candidatus Magasanikbacteria bacterium]|nr:3D domain-containing protein [Candidatus Magasanikbacteria bacterium]